MHVTGTGHIEQDTPLHIALYQVKAFLSNQWDMLQPAMRVRMTRVYKVFIITLTHFSLSLPKSHYKGVTFCLDYTKMMRLKAHPWYHQGVENSFEMHVNFPTTSFAKVRQTITEKRVQIVFRTIIPRLFISIYFPNRSPHTTPFPPRWLSSPSAPVVLFRDETCWRLASLRAAEPW